MIETEIKDYNRLTGQSIKVLKTEPYKPSQSSSPRPYRSHTALSSSSTRQGQRAGDTSHVDSGSVKSAGVIKRC